MATDWITPQALRLMREWELFKDLSEELLKAILSQSELRRYVEGELIFEQGDPGDQLCLVFSGIVEIVARGNDGPKVLAYLGPGECIGEIALLTGSPRTATARAPELAELIILSRDVFDVLCMSFPQFIKQLCIILARRLEKMIEKSPTPPTPKQLQGQLKYFDLSLMLQTLMNSRQTGRMFLDIQVPGQSIRSELYFLEGAIQWAKLGRLQGEEVVYQLFQMPLDGTFSFDGANSVAPPQANVQESPMSLLLEAARLQDEFGRLKNYLPDPKRVLRRKTDKFHWNDFESTLLASELWDAANSGFTLEQMATVDPIVCAAKIYQVAWDMIQAGLIE